MTHASSFAKKTALLLPLHRKCVFDVASASMAMGAPRPEYAALAAEFARLAIPFGDRFDDRLRRDISRLASAIERIDRIVDDATDDDERRARWRFVVDRMNGTDAGKAEGLPIDLRDGADELRAIGQERQVLARLR